MHKQDLCIYLGKGSVARNCLDWLFSKEYLISTIIAIEKNECLASVCKELKIDYHLFKELEPNLNKEVSMIVSLWFPRKIHETDLLRTKRTLNIHPGIVPSYRGNDSSTWSIIFGGPYGVSLLEMNSILDAGGIWVQKEIDAPQMISGGKLHELLKSHAIELFQANFDEIFQGKKVAVPQTGKSRTFTRSMTNKNRRKKLEDFRTTLEFINWARAHNHYPNFFPELIIDGKLYKINLQLD